MCIRDSAETTHSGNWTYSLAGDPDDDDGHPVACDYDRVPDEMTEFLMIMMTLITQTQNLVNLEIGPCLASVQDGVNPRL